MRTIDNVLGAVVVIALVVGCVLSYAKGYVRGRDEERLRRVEMRLDQYERVGSPTDGGYIIIRGVQP